MCAQFHVDWDVQLGRDFKKSTMTKYMTGPTDLYLSKLHMHFEMFYYNSLHA